MKHFVNIVIENDGINENRDIAVDAVIQTANIGLNENALEYEMYESENNTQVLSIPVSKNLNEAQQAFFAKRLANKLFDKGYTKFDIEFSVNEAALNEAAPTTFTPTHYGGPGGLNNVMLHTDGNLYLQKQRDDGQPGREIVRWNGNPTGEGFFGKWNPATIKGTIVNGQRVPYPAGTNFSNAPRAAAAPAAAAPASRVSNTTPTGGLLRRGNRGEEVKQLQRDLGMTGNEIDGIFGPATERAVRTFQQNSGAKVDGLVGPETRAAITKYQAPEDNSAPAQTPDAAPEPIDGGIAPGTTAGGPSQLKQRQQGADADAGAGDAAIDNKMDQDNAAPVAQANAGQAGDAAAPPEAGANTGNVMPRPNNNVSGSNWDKRFAATHNPDGTPKDPEADEFAQDAVDAVDAVDAADAAAPEEIVVTTADQADSIFQNPDSTDAERQAAQEFYGAAPKVDTTAPQAPVAAPVGAVRPRPGGIAGNNWDREYSDTHNRDGTPKAETGGAPVAQANAGEAPVNTTVPARPNSQGGQNRNQDKWDREYGDTHYPDGTLKPDAATTAPVLTAPAVDDNKATTIPDADDTVDTSNPGGLGGAETDNTPSVDPNADARQVVQDFDTWASKYNDKSRGRDMMPNEFVTQALDPALDELSVEKAQRLELDMEGAPATIQRIVQADVERTYGTLEEIIDAANDDTMPKDQQQALQILADMLKSLSINAPGNANENVEPMPKGVFMVEERSIWRSLYGKTHYTNGQARPRTFISESKHAIPEITFEDDDKFFENYGVMWFNEDEMIDEAEYQGRKVKLGKPMAGDVKKFKVYVKNPKGNVVKVNFGQKGARIKKGNPERRRSFRARHNCDNPGPRHKARYWSCRKW